MGRRGSGEGSIYYDHRRQRWVGLASYYVEGRRKRAWVSARTRQEAAHKLRQVLRQLEQGQTPPPERLTVGAYLTQWLQTSVCSSVRPRTYERYAAITRLYLQPALGRLPLQRLSPLDIQRLLASLPERGLSPATVRLVHAVVRRALSWGERLGLVSRNVARLVSPPKAERPTVQPFTVEEARRLLATVKGGRWEAFYLLALTLGLRQGELLGLSWEDVDLDRGLLTIRHQLHRQGGRWALTPLKTPKSRRTLPLPSFVREALRAHRLRQKEERLQAGPVWRESGLVFTSPIGSPLFR